MIGTYVKIIKKVVVVTVCIKISITFSTSLYLKNSLVVLRKAGAAIESFSPAND